MLLAHYLGIGTVDYREKTEPHGLHQHIFCVLPESTMDNLNMTSHPFS